MPRATGPRHGCRLLGLALAAAVGLAGCKRDGGRAAEAAQEQPPVALAPENVAVVSSRRLQSGPEVAGTLHARRTATLRAEVGGAVAEVRVDAGERVKSGQLLARIDASALQDAVRAAHSAVTSAQNALRVAESGARRAHTLAREGAMAEQDAERADAQLEAARAQVEDAKARLAAAEQQAGKTAVRAPFAGVVSERSVSSGDVVASGAALYTVIDPSRLQFEGSVPAASVGALVPGAPVDFSVTGFGGRRFDGHIERVNPAVDPSTGQVRVYVDVPNADGRLLAGLYAQGRVASQASEALSAPATAVDATSTPPTVMKVQDGKVQKVAVEIALRDDVAGAVGFRSGVKQGDVLVLGSARGALADGTPVRVVEDPRAQKSN
ncbi:efflux transporter, RND family, MFP subunit [Anaeromyxobacter dehalogenans 2CP-1]|uniref:Efflux transporter, RND family, MFP subunit n=1 Tax=Anaeromyxobacter dehalogenans (strain ATCC BAA-258 / DSM 21875 / 2CP-1) TaxID=455488 RepID=B8J908_ANAD2|nr:efflux RND transporter periplasmic adaptor subunit [Anaeromyxobacter dehalogenans]ACL63606.1 efflux transporter, RND family, MFP subunit [Anaeromyxobacter dehalogenans 2CP-1]